ncbi:unnamed protein product [Ranitomeya imitator]|uniref:Uncharacterized protein n=1 Tax=Ranitomeya imitator TaxID=111125 RepID=A0ABN9M0Y8_9NEOB|nr:unnamed protein product [Ranitomeya imitator]
MEVCRDELWMRKLIMGYGQYEEKKENDSRDDVIYKTVLHVILSPHRLSSMLFSPSQTVLHIILSLTDCPSCYSLPHRLSSILFSPSQTAFMLFPF